MRERNNEAFDEALLSGYLDGVLTQSERQRVELELERSEAARTLFAQLETLRIATRTTRFVVPDDLQWDERPRTRTTAWSRRLGWLLVLLCLGAVVGLGILEVVAWGGLGAMLALGGVAGVGLLFGSVAADRWRELPHDRYRRVLK